jgi:adenylyltransferase/sulfurtransferase
MLSKEESKRYMKQILLEEVGLNGQILLKKSKVAVIGAGGLGCPVLQYLSSCGAGTLGVIDFDVVDISNLHRQILYTENDLGKKKATVAAERIKQLNPHIETRVHDVLVSEENAKQILSEYDIIVDSCDNFATRYVINDVCVKLNKPLVYGSILGFEGQVAVFNLNGSKNLRDIFPEPPNAEDVPSCSENGVLGTLPGIIGAMMAQEAIKIILNKNTLLNKYVIFKTKEMKMEVLTY